MNASILARSLMLLVLGAFAALRPPPAAADVPPLDIPAACLSSLLDQVSFIDDPGSWYGQAPLYEYNGVPYPMRVSFWRVNCGGGKAALQMRLGNWGDPLLEGGGSMPRLTVRQNGQEADINALWLLPGQRPQTPQPFAPGSAPASVRMFLLNAGDANVDLQGALTMLVRKPSSGEVALTLDIPAFSAAPSALPLDGRLVGNFYDPTKSGEGILVEIVDLHSAVNWRRRMYLQYSWFTYDNEGRPFWISGGGEFLEGDRHVHMPAIYRGGGRFAGGKAATEMTPWGTVDMEFADCNTLRIDYNGNAGLPSNVPSGSGHLEWKRLTSVSGNRCD